MRNRLREFLIAASQHSRSETRNKMKPYITKKEVEETQGKDARTQRFLTAENGCLGGCTSGTTVYAGYEFSAHPGVHEDQEGFYVLEGEGYARLGDLEFQLKPVIHLLHFRVCRIRLRQNRAVSLSRYFGFTVQSDADCC